MKAALALTGALLLLGVAGCAPSRKAMVSPSQRLAEERLGVALTARSGQGGERTPALSTPAADDVVASMLAEELDEDRVVVVALLNNPELKAAYASLGLAEAALLQAWLPRNPSVEGAVRFDVPRARVDGVELGLEQDVLSWVLAPARAGAAAAAREAARTRVAARVIAVAAEARAALVQTVAAREVWARRQSAALAAELGLGLAERLFEAGNVAQVDVLRHRGRLQEAVLAVLEAKGAVVAEEQRLAVVLGLGESQARPPLRLPARMPASPLAEPLGDELHDGQLTARVLEASLPLRALRHDADALARQRGYQNAARFLPALHAVVDVEVEAGHLAAAPGLGVSLPAFDLGQADLLARDAQLAELGARGEQLVNDLRARTASTSARALAAQQAERRLREAILPLRAAELEQGQRLYNGMFLGAFALLELKQRALEAEEAHVRAVLDAWLAHIELEALLAGAPFDPRTASTGTTPSAPRKADSDGGHG